MASVQPPERCNTRNTSSVAAAEQPAAAATLASGKQLDLAALTAATPCGAFNEPTTARIEGLGASGSSVLTAVTLLRAMCAYVSLPITLLARERLWTPMEVSAVGLGRLHLQGGGAGCVRLSGHVLTSHHGHRYSASGAAPACWGLSRTLAAEDPCPRWLVPNSRNGDFAITKPQVSDLQIVANRHLTPAT